LIAAASVLSWVLAFQDVPDMAVETTKGLTSSTFLFLPLAQQVLGRNSHHLAALGLSLHLPNGLSLPAWPRRAPCRQTSTEAPAPRWGQALRGNTVSTRTMKACSSVM
jgi:hypothetical protein